MSYIEKKACFSLYLYREKTNEERPARRSGSSRSPLSGSLITVLLTSHNAPTRRDLLTARAAVPAEQALSSVTSPDNLAVVHHEGVNEANHRSEDHPVKQPIDTPISPFSL